jgi:ParB family transcriptional regulator, chromosome partitioning protein
MKPTKNSFSNTISTRSTLSLDQAPDPNQFIQQLRVETKKILSSFTFTPDHKPLRHHYDLLSIQEWAEHDLKINGIHAPLWVRPHPFIDNSYELVAGQRRLLGATHIALDTVPVRVFDWSNRQAFDAAMAENANREDFTPLEEADHIYTILSRELNISDQTEVTAILSRVYNEIKGKIKNVDDTCPYRDIVTRVFDSYGRISFSTFIRSRATLHKLPEEILTTIRNGELPFSTALQVSTIKDDEQRNELLSHAIGNQLSLSDLKEYVKSAKKTSSSISNASFVKRLKIINSMTSKLELTDDQSAKAEKLIKQLEKLLNIQ